MATKNAHQFYHWWIGLLAKKFYERFGDGALETIYEATSEVGKAIGTVVRKKMPNSDWDTVADVVIKHLQKVYADLDIDLTVVEKSDKEVRFREASCPFQLSSADAKICDALMAIDEIRFDIISDGKAEYKTLRHSEVGPLSCEWAIRRKKK